MVRVPGRAQPGRTPAPTVVTAVAGALTDPRGALKSLLTDQIRERHNSPFSPGNSEEKIAGLRTVAGPNMLERKRWVPGAGVRLPCCARPHPSDAPTSEGCLHHSFESPVLGAPASILGALSGDFVR